MFVLQGSRVYLIFWAFSSLRSNKTFRINIATKNNFGLLHRLRYLQADVEIISASFNGESSWKGIETVFDNKF